MANKNHELDERIIKSARKEFLKHGYRNASLHKIAANAKLTTGALYTRYHGKDDLFKSLIKNVLDQIESISNSMKQNYFDIQIDCDVKTISNVIGSEMQIYNQLMVDYYDECFLFYCRSEGSSVDKMLQDMMNNKIEQTIKYLKMIARPDADLSGIELLMETQFYLFKKELEYNYQNKNKVASIKMVDVFNSAGWKAIFEEIL